MVKPNVSFKSLLMGVEINLDCIKSDGMVKTILYNQQSSFRRHKVVGTFLAIKPR